jgi:hypothetical protein
MISRDYLTAYHVHWSLADAPGGCRAAHHASPSYTFAWGDPAAESARAACRNMHLLESIIYVAGSRIYKPMIMIM